MPRPLYDILRENGAFDNPVAGNYAQTSSMPQYNGNLQNFLQQYQQVQQANQALNQGSIYAKQETPRYREMTQGERLVKGAQELTDFLASAGGNALFGEPKEGENPYEIKIENAPRFLAN